MRAAAVNFREHNRAKQESTFGLETAFANWCKRRWPDKTIQYVAHHFGWSEHIASKAVYAQSSKNTLNDLLHHPKGGAKLMVELVFEATNYSLEQYIAHQAQEAEHERIRWQAEERKLAILAARVSGRGGMGGPSDQPPRARGSKNAPMGSGADGAPVEPRSYAPHERD